MRATAGWGRALWIAGAIAIATKWVGAAAIAHWPALDFLNDRAWNWLGLISRKPITEDYVPLVPWLGVMWWGMAAGQWLLGHGRARLAVALPAPGRWLAVLGRWSLSYYLVHQPVMIGALMLAMALR